MLGALAKVFLRVREGISFVREGFEKVGNYESFLLYTYIQPVKGYHVLPPGGPAGEGHHAFTFPFISSQASEGEASPQPNTMVLKHVLGPAAGTAQRCFLKSQEASSKRSNQASKSESLREPNTRGIFVKVARKFCEPVGKSQSAF